MTHATYVTGDVFDCLAATPSGSVDLVLTSPPFLALRSYLPADHPDKGKEIGQELDPAAFVDTLLALTAEWRRVLAPHGSIAVELGDTYAGRDNGGTGSDPGRHDAKVQSITTGKGWPSAKSACLIPELYRIALAYGINPLTGDPSPTGRWRVRNTVRWCRPNPPVGALGDKFRPATSDMVIACLDTPAGQRRYFDLDAVRGPGSPNTHARTAKGVDRRQSTGKTANDERRGGNWSTLDTLHDTAGAPPLDWWEIPTQPYSGSHYAVWPPALLERPIKAMVPQKVCTVCGEPSRRIVEATNALGRSVRSGGDDGRNDLQPRQQATSNAWQRETGATCAENVTVGWTDCGHNAWRNGIVLDPFAGSGTTLAAATGHGRNALGFDLDPRNPALAEERVGGLFLTHLTLDQYRAEQVAS